MLSLPYSEGRALIGNGDIVFVKGKRNFLARLIRFATRSHYSHAGIAFWANIGGRDRLMIVEAQGGTRRRILNLSFYSGSELVIVKAPRAWEEYQEEAVERIGKVEYGWTDAIYVGIRELFLKYFHIKLPRANFGGEICSEFIAKMLNLPEKNVSPQLLMEQLIKADKRPFLLIK